MTDRKIADLTSNTTPTTGMIVYGTDSAGTTDYKFALGDLPVSSAVTAALALRQPLDSDLTAIAALSTTSFGRALLALADAAALRTTAGLGSAATKDTGTGATNVPTITDADARYQPLDSDLTAIAALTTTSYGRAFLELANAAAGRTALGVVIGTDVQAYSASTAFRTDKLSAFAATTSSELAGVVSDETGSGALVFGTSPTLVTPALGTPSAAVLTNATGLPISTGVSGLGTGVATFLGTPSSANLLDAVTDETGTGSLVFATSPTLVTPALGTPSSATLTNATGLPISTGVSGLGTGVATFLATPSSANLRSALTDETGTGAAVFAAAPTLTGQALVDSLKAYATDQTFTGQMTVPFLVANTYTLNFASSSFGGGLTTSDAVVQVGPTLIAQQSQAIMGYMGFKSSPTIKNLSSVAANLGQLSAFTSRPTITADSQSITWAATADFFSRMNLSTTGGGTLTCSLDYVNFEGAINVADSGVNVSGTYAAFAMIAPGVTGGTLSQVTGLRVAAHSAGSTSSTGVDVQALTGAGANIGVKIAKPSGGTSNIGFQNAGSSVYTRTVSTMSAASSTIDISATFSSLSNTSGGALTITAAPSIPDGVDGQILILLATGANTITLQDQGTLASSNLRLSTTTYVMGQRDNLILIYSSTVGDWVEIARTNVL